MSALVINQADLRGIEVAATGQSIGADKNPSPYAEGVANGYNNAVDAFKRHLVPLDPHRETSARLMNDAITIADGNVRSEVECFCVGHLGDDGHTWWDTSEPFGISDAVEDRKEAAGYVERAIRYIGLRSPDAFPWRMVRHSEKPHLVRFEDKP